MIRKLAIIAGRGTLPRLVAEAADAAGTSRLVAELEGFESPLGAGATRFRLERLVPFLDHLVDEGVSHVCFAGAVHRPRLDPALLDPGTMQLLPRIMAALHDGDDATLRAVVALFEEWGLEVIGVDTLCPDLLPGPGALSTREPGPQDREDATRAAAIVAALGAVDIGQGCVVARKLCLAVEALPGTDAMLVHVAALRGRDGPWAGQRGGVLFKAAKPGQDRRMDLPALGPDTLRAAHAAGLNGIAFAAGSVLVLERATMAALADELGLFLWARAA
ncbi:UDP-2,3-diacylglucosamine diphosphatase LpxI [Rhodobacteraceae bacterium 2376]|uniref:UDP-2,3-diacylglucosamine diphosphatase LpxI n=1 Tax=Rhabdonatronobacter sediminivivens TaxID=2743469 RepID=A0A7Z0KZK2_9RHOB|nr:UDP-2,3-diacylglucosamine diphosphatase LpxI [Rhabdonatronobacter sediminivivens]NYS24518.1 UDP-2,3-diacylglucosamine diphosphatase LpxI [Rhabdonatronobacter sediminivivens]